MKIHLKFTCLTQANNSYTATVKNTSCINKTKHECRKHKKQLKAPTPHPPLPHPSPKKKLLANHRHKPEKCTNNYKTQGLF